MVITKASAISRKEDGQMAELRACRVVLSRIWMGAPSLAVVRHRVAAWHQLAIDAHDS